MQDEAGNDAPAFSGQSVRLADLAQVMGVGVAPGNAQLVVGRHTARLPCEDYNTGGQATVTSGESYDPADGIRG